MTSSQLRTIGNPEGLGGFADEQANTQPLHPLRL
ncbi:MAG: hypothetical protein ETSY2_34905 [Candidatus Entotheonella gemina]|uniref:Uncharacterized protein n=1 Tax=Candidatus Entotheonella gemina TaxID=1429439 RepID=W4LYB4_9BACT|nr:MAG: hypothetical protein ETSY2_34905 [Candidatus Entotheonella gemina]